jgi:hypothetical protein
MRRHESAADYDNRQTDIRETMNSPQAALDLQVLGVCCRSGLNQLDFALVRYRQASPHATLYLECIRVSVFDKSTLQTLMKNSAARYLLHLQSGIIFSRSFAKQSAYHPQ